MFSLAIYVPSSEGLVCTAAGTRKSRLHEEGPHIAAPFYFAVGLPLVVGGGTDDLAGRRVDLHVLLADVDVVDQTAVNVLEVELKESRPSHGPFILGG